MSTAKPITVTAARFVTVDLASSMTGLSASAIRTKIARSIWVEGREYVRAPDGHLMIDLRGYEEWVQQVAPPERRKKRGA
jgi:hypothetical protein